MNYKKKPLLVLLLVFQLCYAQKQLLDNSCDSHYTNFNSLLISNDKSNTTASSYKACSLHFKLNQTDDVILKINLNATLCSSNSVNLTVKYNDAMNIVENRNICEFIQTTTNYVLFLNKTNHFQVTFNTNDASLFNIVNYVAVTRFYYADANTSACQANDFKCKDTAVCLNSSLVCDSIKACPDDSDEALCQQATTAVDSTTPQLNTTTNATAVDDTQPTPASSNSGFGRVKVLVGLLITIALVALIVGLVALYGRRKRRFREFLAQLDNNTDWEYEQLDDGPPSMAASRTNMTPVFSMLNHNESLNRRNITQNSNNHDDSNLMHTLTDLSKANNNESSNATINVTPTASANSSSKPNERTPITVIS